MMRDLDENGVGLYRVSYVHNENESAFDSMLLLRNGDAANVNHVDNKTRV